MNEQPDPRIKKNELGAMTSPVSAGPETIRLFIHDAPGCPFNACIELFDGYLRCWACHLPLTQEAADHVRERGTLTDRGVFRLT